MAYVVMACVVMAYVVMAYVGITYVDMAMVPIENRIGRSGLHMTYSRLHRHTVFI